MLENSASPPLLIEFLRLESSARAARSVKDLGFVVANETHRLIPFRQAFFCLAHGTRFRLETISGLASVDRSTPFHDWFELFLSHLAIAAAGQKTVVLTCNDAPDNISKEWPEWLPEYVLVSALPNRDGQSLGFCILAREEPFKDSEHQTFEAIAQVYGHALFALDNSRPSYLRIVQRLSGRRMLLGLCIASLLALFLPVRQSCLGPAEVTPLTYTSITSPLDGVVATLHVKPNEHVRKGQVLFRLDNTTIRNRLESARRSLGIAKVEEFLSRQKSFMDSQSRGEVATQTARVHEKGSTIGYMQEMLGKMEIRAPADGIVLFGDPADWEGKPVTTGERVMVLADPASAGVTVWLPAKDAINLEKSTELRLFLHSDPINSRDARVVRSSYQPMLSPDGVASYRVTAEFESKGDMPRLGLRGTAKVYGERSSLAYYLFRRPLAAIRQRLGI